MNQEEAPLGADAVDGAERPVPAGDDDATASAAADVTIDAAASEPVKVREKAPPVESRFMFVDIAALRAKQLRRGALPRVESENVDADGEPVAEQDRKLERIAMAEVANGLILYDIPSPSDDDDDDDEDEADAVAPAASAAVTSETGPAEEASS